MKAVGILVLLMGLVAIAFAAKYALTGTLGRDPAGSTQPKRQLDNVREKSKDLEQQMQQNVDDVAKKVGEAEH